MTSFLALIVITVLLVFITVSITGYGRTGKVILNMSRIIISLLLGLVVTFFLSFIFTYMLLSLGMLAPDFDVYLEQLKARSFSLEIMILFTVTPIIWLIIGIFPWLGKKIKQKIDQTSTE